MFIVVEQQPAQEQEHIAVEASADNIEAASVPYSAASASIPIDEVSPPYPSHAPATLAIEHAPPQSWHFDVPHEFQSQSHSRLRIQGPGLDRSILRTRRIHIRNLHLLLLREELR